MNSNKNSKIQHEMNLLLKLVGILRLVCLHRITTNQEQFILTFLTIFIYTLHIGCQLSVLNWLVNMVKMNCTMDIASMMISESFYANNSPMIVKVLTRRRRRKLNSKKSLQTYKLSIVLRGQTYFSKYCINLLIKKIWISTRTIEK